MSARRRLGPFRSPYSSLVTPSSKYIGCWPATQFVNPAGTLIAPSITLAVAGISANTIGDTSAPAAGNQAWIEAGKLVRVRNTGTIPTGLSATTLYYLGRPTATTVSFHTTRANAIANTNLVSMSGGSANVEIYEAAIYDRSGQGNDMNIPTNNNSLTWLATPPYLSAGSSGSNDVAAAVLATAAFASRLAFPDNSFLMAARVISGTWSTGRSVWGCGVSGSADGPRLNADTSDSGRLSLQWYHSGGSNINLGLTAAQCFLTTALSHIAIAIDGPNRLAHMWVNGERDLTVYNKSLAASGTVTWPANIRWGGAAANNCHASGWNDMHLLAFEGALPANTDQLVRVLATSRYYRLSNRDI